MMTARRQSAATAHALSALLRDLAVVPGVSERVVRGVQLDSRLVRAGELFLACNGVQRRGCDFIAAALANGAIAVAYENAAGETPPQPQLTGAETPQIAAANLAQHARLIAERLYDEPSRDLLMARITCTIGITSCSHY